MEAPVQTPPELHLTIPLPGSAAQGKSVRGHRVRAQVSAVVLRGELPCAPPEVALVQSASLLSFRELVVAIDHLILPRRDYAGDSYLKYAWLVNYLGECSARGAKRLRAACSVARVGAESRFETLARFELARMGLDTLELQADLHDDAGLWIGRFDLVDRAARKIIEYDGEQHRLLRRQYLRDLKKLDRAREANYSVLRLHKEDFHPSKLWITRRSMCEFLGRESRPLSRTLQTYFSEPL